MSKIYIVASLLAPVFIEGKWYQALAIPKTLTPSEDPLLDISVIHWGNSNIPQVLIPSHVGGPINSNVAEEDLPSANGTHIHTYVVQDLTPAPADVTPAPDAPAPDAASVPATPDTSAPVADTAAATAVSQ